MDKCQECRSKDRPAGKYALATYDIQMTRELPRFWAVLSRSVTAKWLLRETATLAHKVLY
jgi:hypothetical protein